MGTPTAITTPFAIAYEQAVDALRRKHGLVLQYAKNQAVFPAEFLTPELLEYFRAQKCALSLLITPARAKSLSLTTEAIDITTLPFEQITQLADPTLGIAESMHNIASVPLPPHAGLLLTLAKHASLLPAMIIIGGDIPNWPRIDMAAVETYLKQASVTVEQTTSLPIEGAENARAKTFRANDGSVHLALVIGDAKDGVLTRVHSSCVTGDILGSLRCDCGDQLSLAIHQLAEAKNGVLLYLHQEGRGIGITNKLRAYKLQELGFDTYEANALLGFDEDERDFALAAAILKTLGIHNVRLLTNNPKKIDALQTHGITISERIPLIASSGKHNHAYLTAKGKKAGHLF